MPELPTQAEAAVSAASPAQPAGASYGLRRHVLSQTETLAQSISAIAPSTTPPLTIPLVFALAGDGTVLAYGLAVVLMLLVGLCMAAFAQQSASPGSLYVYTQASLPPEVAAVTAWALLFAYVATASAVIGGFVTYAYVVFGAAGAHVPALLWSALAAGAAILVAYRDVKISARLMLYIEAVAAALIVLVVGLTIVRHGFHVDRAQFRWRGFHAAGLRAGMMLAVFSFVGFESATTLGAEAREPLRTIPRAVVGSALLVGLFFLMCAYGEVLGFRGAATSLGDSTAPMRFLATNAGVPFAGPLIDLGVLISMFAATLACVMAASRVLLLMAHHGLASKRLTQTHAQHETPAVAGLLAGLLAFLPAAVLILRGVSSADVYGWMGTLSVYAFLSVYGIVAVGLAAHRRKAGRLGPGTVLLTAAAAVAMLLAIVSNLYPRPPAPLSFFPYVYAAYLLLALGWTLWGSRGAKAAVS